MCALGRLAGAQPTAASAPTSPSASAPLDNPKKSEKDKADMYFEPPPFPTDASLRRNGKTMTKEGALQPAEQAASASKFKPEEVKKPCGLEVRQDCR